ncbi:MAG: NAD(P)-dependent oxidoreductase [Clostridia bacterium]|nr:NAD(P)-dependent oxidoreductase [Clostridia bacterium]
MEYSKEEINKKAEYCLGCKVKMCTKGCPLGNDITQFIAYVKEKKYEQAYHILCNTSVLSPICGRICPHKSQCEGACVRGIKGDPVCIGELEAYVGDMGIEKQYQIPKFSEEKKEKRIAVIGGGPAGLTAAAWLIRNGYEVTIYEKYDKLGGILRHGIPEFRLEKEILDKQIQKIIDLGIKVQYQKSLGKDYVLEALEKEYDAIFLGIGANISAKMGIEGEELQGVYGGNELLEYKLPIEYIGKKVVVIGGGNVAMDTARTIKRLGAKEVNIVYRRAEKQMPAERKEIEAAKQEGIQFLFQTNVIKVIGANKVEKVECIKTELVKKEGEAREVPVDIIGSNFIMDTDYVVMAVGSKPEEGIVHSLGLELTSKGNIKIDENYRTSRKKVFAGGDICGVKATVAWASRSGREAARAIMQFLEEGKSN